MSLILSGTSGLSDVDGSAATPAIRGTDANTGIFFPAADTIAFSEGGVESVRIDASGNVGVGTVAAGITGAARLQVAGSGTTAGISLYRTDAPLVNASICGIDGVSYDGSAYVAGGTINFRAAENWTATNHGTVIQFRTTASGSGGALFEAMRVNSDGNLGIGTVSPAAKLTSNVSGAGSVTALNLTNDNSGFAAGTGPAINFGLADSTTLGAFGKLEVLNETASTGSNAYMAFSTRNADVLAEKMRISAAGNVGIGTTSTSNVRLSSNAATGSWAGTFYANSGGASTTGLNIYGLSFGGNYSNGSAEVNIVYGSAGAGLDFSSYNGTTVTPRMRLDSSGNLMVGTTGFAAGQNAKHIAPNVILSSVNSTAANGQIVFYNPNGVVGQIYTDGTSTVYVTSSDYRLKEITGVVTATEAKDFIMALQPKQGTWKVDGSKFVGFLAHEFKNVSPSSVFGEKDAVDKDGKPVYQGMQAASSEVMANLIALVQEQQALIIQLQADVAIFKGAA